MDRFLTILSDIENGLRSLQHYTNREIAYRQGRNRRWEIGRIAAMKITSKYEPKHRLIFSFNLVPRLFTSDDISACWRECLDCQLRLPCRDIFEHYQRAHITRVDTIETRYGLQFVQCPICGVRLLRSLYYIHLIDAHPDVQRPTFQEIIILHRNV